MPGGLACVGGGTIGSERYSPAHSNCPIQGSIQRTTMSIARFLTMLAGFTIGALVWHATNELGDWLDAKRWVATKITRTEDEET